MDRAANAARHRAKKRAGLMLLCALLAGLCSACGGKPLAEREVVHAILYAKGMEGYTAVLVVANTAGAEDTPYKIAADSGVSPAQALHHAEQALEGVPFYGVTELLGLPAGTTWEEAVSIGGELRAITQPAPEIETLLLDGQTAMTLEKNAAKLYQSIRAAEKRYGLDCGTERLFAQPGAIVLPQYNAAGYRLVTMRQGEAPYTAASALESQLGAVLSGQSDRIECTFAGDTARFSAGVEAIYDVQPTAEGSRLRVTARLNLREPSLTSYLMEDEESLRNELQRAVNAALDTLLQNSGYPQTDLFHFGFWAACYDEQAAGNNVFPRVELVFPQ